MKWRVPIMLVRLWTSWSCKNRKVLRFNLLLLILSGKIITSTWLTHPVTLISQYKFKEPSEYWTEPCYFCAVWQVFSHKQSLSTNKWCDITFQESFSSTSWIEWEQTHGMPLQQSEKNWDSSLQLSKFRLEPMTEWEDSSISFIERLTTLMDRMVRTSERNLSLKSLKSLCKRKDVNWSVSYLT